MTAPPSSTAETGAGSTVRRRAVAVISIAVDHDATDVAKGTVPRFHGSSESGITTKICRPGLSRRQPTAYATNRMRERAVWLDERQATATPAPRTIAPGRTFTRAPPGVSPRRETLARHVADPEPSGLVHRTDRGTRGQSAHGARASRVEQSVGGASGGAGVSRSYPGGGGVVLPTVHRRCARKLEPAAHRRR